MSDKRDVRELSQYADTACDLAHSGRVSDAEKTAIIEVLTHYHILRRKVYEAVDSLSYEYDPDFEW